MVVPITEGIYMFWEIKYPAFFPFDLDSSIMNLDKMAQKDKHINETYINIPKYLKMRYLTDNLDKFEHIDGPINSI